MRNIKTILFCLLCFLNIQAQNKDSFPEINPEFFTKKFRMGIAFNQSWSTIVGSNHPFDYFIKPSIGGGIEAEYKFSKNIGIGAGLLFQQRGAGIYTSDIVKEVGDPDSTHRHRFRYNCIDLPIRLIFKSNKGLTNGNRWSGSVGVIPMYSFKTNSIFHSIEDGFHQIEDWGDNFKKFDLSTNLSFGLDINAGDASVLQVHLYCSYGLFNTYNNTALYGNAKGNHLLFGIKATALL